MKRPILLLLALLLSPPAMAGQATVLRDSELRAEPYADAAVVTTLRANSRLDVMKRQGGWYQVRDGQQRHGWLRMSAVRLGAIDTSKSVDGKGIGQTLQLLQTGRSGSSGTTVATGIRGLDADDVSQAKPDHQALEQLAHYQVTPKTARSFATKAQLHTQPIGYLPEKKQ